MANSCPRKLLRTTKEIKKTFEQLRQECLESGTLFEDQYFITDTSTLKEYVSGPVEWKRPKDIVKDPQFIVDGASRFDVNQGRIADCWLLSAIANLTLNEDVFKTVVPEGQSFTDKYAGIFLFRFWQYGRWVEVVVDDRLPTQQNKLICMKSSTDQPNEFWGSLLEKAYAKCICGSYAALKGGNCSEAMEDFTGGISEVHKLKNSSEAFYDYLLKVSERTSFKGCTSPPAPSKMMTTTPQGILYGHVYSITDVRKFKLLNSKTANLIRLRNPWGFKEWKGDWCDSSNMWENVSEEDKKAALRKKKDGEFWISYEDFLNNFESVELCHLQRTPEMDKQTNERWEVLYLEGSWVIGSSAGGNLQQYPDTFKTNMRFMITLNEADDNDNDGKCTVIIALMQKDRRSLDVMRVVQPMSIGYYIYELMDAEKERDPLDFDYIQENTVIVKADFTDRREYSSYHKLSPGSYCIIPCTYKPNEEGEFILRVCTEKKICCKENDQDIKINIMDTKPTLEEMEDENKLVNAFRTIAGKDGEIDWEDLAKILNSAALNLLNLDFPFAGFHKDSCRSMITMMDPDMFGKMGVYEFMELWENIRFWTKVFKKYDTGRTGWLDPFIILEALKSTGFSVGTDILNALLMRYGDKKGRIAYDDFLMCALKLRAIMAMLPTDQDKSKTMDLKNWMKRTLYM